MVSEGYVLMWRGIIGNPQFRGKDDEYAAMWLVLRAAWKETTVRVSREAVKLSRGECAYALSFLAQAWGCSKTKAHVTLKHLERVGFIRTQAERGYTRIYVVNYNTYQTPANADGTPEGTTTERGRNADGTNKNTLNTLKEKNNAQQRYRFDGKVVRLTHDDFAKWESSFPNIDLVAECQSYDDWAASQPTAQKDWFVRLSATLRKHNDAAKANGTAGLPKALADAKARGAVITKTKSGNFRCEGLTYSPEGKVVGA